MFWDTAEVKFRAGQGGDGLVSFLREKYREKGGPDGGDGGHGASIYLEARTGESTLSYFRAHRSLRAPDGERGRGRHQHGKSGSDVTYPVPVGTIIKEGDQVLTDLDQPGERYRVARGGRGGFGNAHFTASSRQIPEVAELGDPGQERSLTLELKLIADVALIGLPNAGKSTLLARITHAKPKIAAYPFTTTVPGLGVVEERGFHFVVCDIPGLIEGAHQGKGLGHEFLRHVERSRLLVHLLDGTSQDPKRDYTQIRSELEKFNPKLPGKPELLVINKIDQPEARGVKVPRRKVDYFISAATGEGTSELLGGIAARLAQLPPPGSFEEPRPKRRRYTPASDPRLYLVAREGEAWRVTGGNIEKFARRLDLSNGAAQVRLRDIMARTGVLRELTRQGAAEGERVKIGEQSLEFRLPRLKR